MFEFGLVWFGFGWALRRVNSISVILRRPAYYRWRKTPDIQLSVRAQSNVWVEPSTFRKSAGRLPLNENSHRRSRDANPRGEGRSDCESGTLTTRPRRPRKEVEGNRVKLDQTSNNLAYGQVLRYSVKDNLLNEYEYEQTTKMLTTIVTRPNDITWMGI